MSNSTARLEPRNYLRQAAIRRYDVLDSPPDESLEEVVDLASGVFGVKMAFLSFLDVDREWLKARRRFPWREIPLRKSFGLHAIQSGSVTVIEDAKTHPQFAENPLVTGPPNVRFYAASPLVTPDGHRIGVLAVLDSNPVTPSPSQRRKLASLADLVMDRLERRRHKDISTRPLSDASAHIAVLGKDGTILQMNEAWRSYARSHDEDNLFSVEPGTNYIDACNTSGEVVGSHYAEQAKNGLTDVLRGRRKAFEMVYPFYSRSVKQWFRMQVSALSAPQLNARAVISHTDVTPEERRRQHARLLETAVEEANDVVLITEAAPLSEPGPRITYVNPAFTNVTGYEPEDVIGKSPRILQGPDTEPWILDEMYQHLVREEPFEGEAINYRKNGTPYVNRWSVAPVRNEEGVVTHWVSVQQDVTEERQVQRELLQAQEEERSRIARKMHDEMGGLLTSLQMSVHDEKDQKTDGIESEAVFDRTKNLVVELSNVVRRLTEQLHSRVLEDYGLSGALTRLVTKTETESNVTVELRSEIGDDERLPSVIEKVAFRGVQKALRNVQRRPDTTRIRIHVEKNRQMLRIQVVGEGTRGGFETELSGDAPDDLVELKHRIERLNGTLHVTGENGRGIRIDMTLPVTFLPPPFA